MSVWEALATLDGFVDLSDPDTSLPNSVHAFQATRYLGDTLPSRHLDAQQHARLPGGIYACACIPHVYAPGHHTHVTWLSPPSSAPRGCARPACLIGCSSPDYSTTWARWSTCVGATRRAPLWPSSGPSSATRA
eukprot:scaffold106168_cov57-Phaeocystis_antarctica.AAC.5